MCNLSKNCATYFNAAVRRLNHFFLQEMCSLDNPFAIIFVLVEQLLSSLGITCTYVYDRIKEHNKLYQMLYSSINL